MKQLFLLPVLFSSLAVQGQANKPAKKTREIFIGVNFSPDYSSRKLKNNNGNAYNDVIIDQRNGIETAKLGFTTGLDLFITVSKRVGLEAGVQYSNKGYQTKKQNLVFGFPDPALPTTSKFIYSYQFIDIPLRINFTAGRKKASVHFKHRIHDKHFYQRKTNRDLRVFRR